MREPAAPAAAPTAPAAVPALEHVEEMVAEPVSAEELQLLQKDLEGRILVMNYIHIMYYIG